MNINIFIKDCGSSIHRVVYLCLLAVLDLSASLLFLSLTFHDRLKGGKSGKRMESERERASRELEMRSTQTHKKVGGTEEDCQLKSAKGSLRRRKQFTGLGIEDQRAYFSSSSFRS